MDLGVDKVGERRKRDDDMNGYFNIPQSARKYTKPANVQKQFIISTQNINGSRASCPTAMSVSFCACVILQLHFSVPFCSVCPDPNAFIHACLH
jgi:hypothetical protein